ncbi:MAG: outer rane efflux protein, partial [Bacteroidetes bacterium]|nr:outer rane efflux protein [Bacteroidota bacterium]
MILAGAARISAQDAVKILTMDDCRKIGIEKSTQILKSNNSLKLTGVQLLYTYGQFLPDLGFNANYTYNAGRNLLTTSSPTLIDSRQNILNYQLVSTLNIFNGLNDYSALKSATLSRSAAELNLERAKQQISLDIAQSYLQVILDRRIVDYARENLNASLQREAQLGELTNVGRKAKVDLYQQEAQTSSDSLFLIQSQTKAKNDRILLFRKILITETEKYDIADVQGDDRSLGLESQSVNDLVRQGIDQRPDLKSTENVIKASEWNIKQYKSGYLPKLNLFAGLISNGGYLDRLYVNGTDQLITTPQQSLGNALFGQVYGTVGLNMNWKLFDKFYTKSNVDANKIYLDNAKIDRDDLTVQISSDIKQAYNDYLDALAQISTTNKGLFGASQAYDAIKGRYDLGAANFVELSTAQAVL